MAYFSQRNGREKSEIKQTAKIGFDEYHLIIDCCERYFDNIAWRFPSYYYDERFCRGISIEKLCQYLKYEIPNLFGVRKAAHGYWFMYPKPAEAHLFSTNSTDDEYDQYSLLDFIEFLYNNCKDINEHLLPDGKRYLIFSTTCQVLSDFRKDLNDIFQKTGLLYYLNEHGEIERVLEYDTPVENMVQFVDDIQEKSLKDLVDLAIKKHKSYNKQDNKDAVEKIWDALERLKTYYGPNKKKSAAQLVKNMAGENIAFNNIFNEELAKLTEIGNKFRIRHHETDKIEINDSKFYDYFFNRCLSLITLVIQYIK